VTVHPKSSASNVSGAVCVSEECLSAWNAVSAVAPRGWQPNPVISPESAAMCETDYKSFPQWPPLPRDRRVGYRVHFSTGWERGRHG
jgi:hypothetical protein